jgi:hypothetical protein
MYTTAVVLEDGEVHFFDDIYGEDKKLEREMRSSLDYPHPKLPVFPRLFANLIASAILTE